MSITFGCNFFAKLVSTWVVMTASLKTTIKHLPYEMATASLSLTGIQSPTNPGKYQNLNSLKLVPAKSVNCEITKICTHK